MPQACLGTLHSGLCGVDECTHAQGQEIATSSAINCTQAAAAHLRAMHERMDAVSEGGDMDRMRLQLLRFALAALTKVLEMTSQDPALRFPSVCHHLVLGAANMMRILANLEGGPDRAERCNDRAPGPLNRSFRRALGMGTESVLS